MRVSVVAAALVASAAASYNYTEPVVYTTEIVSEYTTYCPGPTTIAHGTKTYTITEATTFTVTDCPCTISKPVAPSTPVYTPPPVVHTSAAPYPSSNASVPVYTPPAGTAAPTSVAPTSPPAFTGAASRFAASGASLAAIFGLAAYVLVPATKLTSSHGGNWCVV
ncbi:uncharacterized protein BDR25DRAFT_308871 [Lindgomyces ingoldianus]|uniref:Uncharacterized protein n=1 Tax=Lindgomyces ingoldianus TaxID=673940 RepID=A0ACB6RGZ2_9PLEO|nr:uncharacterized protein BDR25DRAFT_308871 [Lindgomyces ingoldianus]KAF2478043.1 hypothetical protein BDR25DRAFT_308871 [Lindgomyces ingoldianus]